MLDVGCGGGILSESLASAGAETTAIDISETVLQVARLHLHESGLSVRYLLSTVEELSSKQGETFDVVTCMELLEHVPNPASVVAAIAELLEPGGHCFFSTLNRTPAAFLLGIIGAEYVAGVCPKGTHRYDRFIKPSELGQWIRAAGLQVADISGIHYNPVTGSVRLGGRVGVNYVIHARKPALS